MEIGDKVYVNNWMAIYSEFYRFVNGEKELIFKWKTELPQYYSTNFFVKKKYKPKLTLKGEPYKNGEKILIYNELVYSNFEYNIVESIKHPNDNNIIYLLESTTRGMFGHGCFVQIGEKGLTTMTVKEQKKVAHLESEKRLQALAKDNLGKWKITDDFKQFPKELIKILYDREQRTQFGSGMTRAIIKHKYIAKDYTVNGNDLYMGWKQNYNGKGCDLTGKDTIQWSEMAKRFPENEFTN